MNGTMDEFIEKLATGVPGLDQVLGEGLPAYSFNLVAGSPGTGKTTLAHQIMFANARPECRALYFTVLGEPPLKMLRYQRRMSFFDIDKIDSVIRFINLSDEVMEQDLTTVLESIVREVKEFQPGIVVVDSFRTVARTVEDSKAGAMGLQAFLQRLALFLTGWQATSFLVGEYLESEMRDNPVFTVADGILWLYQSVERNSIVRKLHVMKLRGQAPMPGLHTFRITRDGLQVFPRMVRRVEMAERVLPRRRISMGVAGLDEMLAGGIQAGDSLLVAGPSGSGKTVLGTQFIAEGVKHGEPGVLIVFEEHPREYISRAKGIGFDLEEMTRRGALKVIYLRPLDLSVDETLQEIQDAVEQIGARRVVIDSLSGFELALAPTFREDFRESMYRMVGTLTGTGITVLMTVEIVEAYNELRFSPHVVSFLADDVILLRYMELEGQLRKVIAVVKMRSSGHSKDFRAYEITSQGFAVGEPLREYQGIITGVPKLLEVVKRAVYSGLTDQEIVVLERLTNLRQGTVESIAQKTGLRRPVLAAALSRLVALDYALKVVEKGQTIYRAAL